MLSDSANFCRKHISGNLLQNTRLQFAVCSSLHLDLCVETICCKIWIDFIAFTMLMTLRHFWLCGTTVHCGHRTVPACIQWTQGLACDAEVQQLHADTRRCWSESMPDCCMVWSTAACNRCEN